MTHPGAPSPAPNALAFPLERTCPYRPPAGYQKLQDQGPIFQLPLYNGQLAWLVTGHAEARALLADPRLSSDRQTPGFPFPTPRDEALAAAVTPLVGVDGPVHARQRRMVLPSFGARRITAMRDDIRAVADRLLDTMLAAGSPADLVTAYAQPLPSMVVCRLLGVPYADHEFFWDRSHALLTAATADEAERARSDLETYLFALITAKEKAPGDGLLDDLITRQRDEGALDHDELTGIALVLLIAGHESTANMIALSTFALFDHPAQLAAVRADPGLLPDAVDELLRHLSIADGLLRVATEDITIADRLIRAGEGVVVVTSLTNRDPDIYDSPDTLDIRRSARQHMAFGHGVHQCLGQSLARVEIEIALNALLTRVPHLRLAENPGPNRPSKPAGTIQGLLELPVSW